ncbi:YtkA-like protein [Sinobaca qinghaiensis]|uniref:YtkA-like protein n=1 Tax=Sinobaca qinghaiensis TaxID=342944 RepID=A0A419V475_9BACL|nr:FixH family protein [Sinobaca qinghaiensis]RKD73294.1 YtkA-like protein [Sinobaca qinghaiensis]
MKKWAAGSAAFMLLLLSACGGSGESEAESEPPSTEPIEVAIHTDETVEAGKAVQVEAQVEQEGEAVEDANEVLFEIWREGEQETGEQIEGEHKSGGEYTLEYTFEESGTYFITAHVTARNMHSMPTEELEVE